MGTKNQATNVEFDIRGQICPSCLLTALKEVNDRQATLRSGEETLSILTDNRQATATIPDAIGNMGYRVAVNRDGAHYRIDIQRAD